MKKFYLSITFILLLHSAFAQLNSICALETDRIDQMNQAFVDLLALTTRQQEQVSQLNQQAFSNFCSLRTKYTSPKEAPHAEPLLTRKKWGIGITRNMKLMELLSAQQQAVFVNLVNGSASLFYKNDIFYHRTGKSVDEFVQSSRFLPENETTIQIIHTF